MGTKHSVGSTSGGYPVLCKLHEKVAVDSYDIQKGSYGIETVDILYPILPILCFVPMTHSILWPSFFVCSNSLSIQTTLCCLCLDNTIIKYLRFLQLIVIITIIEEQLCPLHYQVKKAQELIKDQYIIINIENLNYYLIQNMILILLHQAEQFYFDDSQEPKNVHFQGKY